MITPKPEKITPAVAAKWLDKNKSNRALRPGIVEKYANDMKTGRWTNCAAPIWFYENGDIADGQHRLWAIVESGVAQSMLVGHGLSKQDGLNIDTGVTRNLVDNARISGEDTTLTHTLIAICRGIVEGDRSSHNLSNARKMEFIESHREAARFAMQYGGKGGKLRTAVLNSAIARAWYYEADKDRLARFGLVISTGFAEGAKESSAIALRNYILQNKMFASGEFWRDSFLKSQNAIYYFMRGTSLTVIRGIADERYKLKEKPSSQPVTVKADDLEQAPKPPKHNPEATPSGKVRPKVMVVGLWPQLRAQVSEKFHGQLDLRFFDSNSNDLAVMQRMAKSSAMVLTIHEIPGMITNVLKKEARKHESVHGSARAVTDRLTKFTVNWK